MSSDFGDIAGSGIHQNTKQMLMFFMRQMGMFTQRATSAPLNVLNKTANSIKKAHKQHAENVAARKQYKIDLMRNRIEEIRNKSELQEIRGADYNNSALLNKSRKTQLKADRLAIRNDYREAVLEKKLAAREEARARHTKPEVEHISNIAERNAERNMSQAELSPSQLYLANLIGQKEFDRNGFEALDEKDTKQLISDLLEEENSTVSLNVPDENVHGCIMGICSIVGIDAKEMPSNAENITMSKQDFDKLAVAVDYIKEEINKYYGNIEMDYSDDAVTVIEDSDLGKNAVAEYDAKDAIIADAPENESDIVREQASETATADAEKTDSKIVNNKDISETIPEQKLWKDDLRERVTDAAEHSFSEGDFEERLKERGVDLARAKDGENLYRFIGMENRAMRGDNLGNGLDRNSLVEKYSSKFSLESHVKTLNTASKMLEDARKSETHIHTPEVR